MKKQYIYFYRGENGTLTTPIYLPDAHPTVYVLLTADPGKTLSNGQYTTSSVKIPESGVHNWTEVDE